MLPVENSRRFRAVWADGKRSWPPCQPVRVPSAAIHVADLRKQYGENEAVGGVSFTVQPGEVFALLGPNGAGKTTTLEILEGYRTRTSGAVEVLGLDPATGGAHLRERIGIVLQATAVEPYLTVQEVVTRNAGYYPSPRDVDSVIKLVGLDEKAEARVKTLSGGQQRRLDVALGIVGGPELLFLDEPTTGFDPSARRGAWELVRTLAGEGTTILLTTHYMDEAQHLADRVAVIARGHIVAEGTPDTIGGRADAAARIRFVLPAGIGVDRLPVAASLENGHVEVRTEDEVRVLHQLTGWALDNGVSLEQLTVERPSLEDVYLQLTGSAEEHHE
jgi:ABC-2 type transport system ATP-binding protein